MIMYVNIRSILNENKCKWIVIGGWIFAYKNNGIWIRKKIPLNLLYNRVDTECSVFMLIFFAFSK